MRHRHRTALAIAALTVAAAGCWSDIKEPPAQDSVGAYEPAGGPSSADGGIGGAPAPSGGPLRTPVDTSGSGGPARAGSTGRDTTAATRPPQP